MNASETSIYEQQLQAQRRGLLEQLARLRGGSVSRSDASDDHFRQRERDSSAQMSSERELEFALDARESAELEAIDAALRRIADGSYGKCEDCGKKIPESRLEAIPYAAVCVQCAAISEQQRGYED